MQPLRSLEQDVEFSGKLSQALKVEPSGQMFAWLMASLDTDLTTRPTVRPDDYADPQSGLFASLYRRSPLQNQQTELTSHTSAYLSAGNVSSARLWQAMHPDALSLRDDKLKLSNEVLQNCSLYTRAKLTDASRISSEQMPAMLHNILQQVQALSI